MVARAEMTIRDHRAEFGLDRALSNLGESDADNVEDASQQFGARIGSENFELLVRVRLRGSARELPLQGEGKPVLRVLLREHWSA